MTPKIGVGTSLIHRSEIKNLIAQKDLTDVF